MDDRTVELACAALEEFLRAKILGRNGEAVAAFLAHREHMRRPHATGLPPTRDAAPAENARPVRAGDARGAVPGAAADSGALQDLKRRVEALTAERDRAERDRQDLARRLENAQEDLREARDAARAAEARLAAQAAQRLRGQEELLGLQHFLDTVSPGARELAAGYFTLDDLATFLVQCGQFSRINQLWEACGKAVTSGEAPAGLSPMLERLLGLFNRASGQNPATLIAPAPGEGYRSEIHFRVNSDGTTVRALLLPGLRNPGGKMQQPALVELR